MDSPDVPAVARIRSGSSIVGGGALFSDGLVLTCAHVVNAALGRPRAAAGAPEELVRIDFPLLDAEEATCKVISWHPLGEFGVGDLAVLCLELPLVSQPAPMPFVEAVPSLEAKLRMFGFPRGMPTGVWKTDLSRAGPMVGGWEQLVSRGGRDYKLQRGFSGCPVVDGVGRVVGVFAQSEEAPDIDTGVYIPTAVARQKMPDFPVVPVPDPETGNQLSPLGPPGRPAVLRIAPDLLALLNYQRDACRRRNVGVFTPTLLLMLLDIVGGVTSRVFDALESGLASGLAGRLRAQLESPELRDTTFADFGWTEREDFRLASDWARTQGAEEISQQHLLVGILEAESSTTKGLRKILGEGDFARLLELAMNDTGGVRPTPGWPLGDTSGA